MFAREAGYPGRQPHSGAPPSVHSLMRVGTDVMLVPSNDEFGMDPMHAQMATLRAIENGYSFE